LENLEPEVLLVLEILRKFKLEVLRFWKFLRKPDTEVLSKIFITTTEKATQVIDVWALHSNSHIRCQQSSGGVYAISQWIHFKPSKFSHLHGKLNKHFFFGVL
jgi:hypothetical protein